MAERVEGKVALITGAGCVGPGWGNGRAGAVLFAREGAKVFAVDKSEEAMAESWPASAITARSQLTSATCSTTARSAP